MTNKERERYRIPVAVFMILIRDSELLMIQRATTGWMDGFWSLPAGSLDPNEDVLSAVIRETKEEVGVDINKENARLVNVMHTNVEGKDWLNLIFMTKEWVSEPKVCEPNKHSEVRWVDIYNLPEDTIPYVRAAINDYLNDTNLTIFGWEVKNQ